MTPEELSDIEAIKQLKARYFRLMDQRHWDEWADLFTEDYSGTYYGAHAGWTFSSRAEFVSEIRAWMTDAVSVHHGHMPEIELLSATTAKGIWAMSDYVHGPQVTVEGSGHYIDEYVKQDGQWKIKSTQLTRLRSFETSSRPLPPGYHE